MRVPYTEGLDRVQIHMISSIKSMLWEFSSEVNIAVVRITMSPKERCKEETCVLVSPEISPPLFRPQVITEVFPPHYSYPMAMFMVSVLLGIPRNFTVIAS